MGFQLGLENIWMQMLEPNSSRVKFSKGIQSRLSNWYIQTYTFFTSDVSWKKILLTKLIKQFVFMLLKKYGVYYREITVISV